MAGVSILEHTGVMMLESCSQEKDMYTGDNCYIIKIPREKN